MFKIIILFSLMFLSLSQALARVDVRWFSVACVVLEDEETQIMFDPMFTRAGLKHWFNFAKLRADQELLSTLIKEHKLDHLKALFASHSHFDHSIDAPVMAKLTGATFYVDESSQIIAKAYQDPLIKTQLFENLKPIKIGKFTITPMKRTHAHIRTLGLSFLRGPVPKDFDFDFYDYQMGDTWFYYVEHPQGKILIDQSAEAFVTTIESFTHNVDVLIQGVANRPSDEAVLNGYMTALKPSVFIATHFDNFFFAFKPKEETSYLPGVKIEEMMEKLKNTYPDKKIILPTFGERIDLFK